MSLALHLAAGRRAEDQALELLRTAGLKLRARNYRCPQGELDLVMDDGETLVMVEVRYRHERGFGGAAETVGTRKQDKLLRAAQHFLQQDVRHRRRPLRFDVIAVTEGAGGALQTEWIKDAFRADF
ncbi:MAG TPA: YraN family protein [Gammaproteobacteria bacterium]|nr:YraN family protein [Gammaproteobacteria bacterium]